MANKGPLRVNEATGETELTWLELKQMLEAGGMRDEDKIFSMTIQPHTAGEPTLIMRNDETTPDGSLKGWQVSLT